MTSRSWEKVFISLNGNQHIVHDRAGHLEMAWSINHRHVAGLDDTPNKQSLGSEQPFVYVDGHRFLR